MILIEGKKFACDTCIKGHRSSACKHTDRPLFEIQKKGRPITQCSHCRELRKTKQVHVKCLCGDAKGNKEESGPTKPAKKILDAAYPTGVPTTLEASVVLHPDPSSDSDQPGSRPASCSCETDMVCHCAVPRKIKRVHQKDSTSALPLRSMCSKPIRPDSELARDYRPVLPKPPHPQDNRPQIDSGPIHIPSVATSAHISRHHSHADTFYSPYGRAYETSHSYDHSHRPDDQFVDPTSIGEIADIFTTEPDDQSFPWDLFNTTGTLSQSACNCGGSCACHTCLEHRGPAQALLNMSLGVACANPTTCQACFGGTVLTGSALQASAAEISAVDDWVRQLAAPPLLQYGSQPFVYAIPQEIQATASTSTLHQYSGSASTSDLSSQWTPTRPSRPSECCGGSCRCPPGLCSCVPDCCGCCQGCTCEDRERNQVTFAISGERSPCHLGRAANAGKSCMGGILLADEHHSSPSHRSRASSMGLRDGLEEEWNRGAWYDPQIELSHF